MSDKHIWFGGPEYEPLHITERCKSFGELCLKRLNRHGNNVLLIDGLTGAELTAYKLRDASVRVAQSLRLANIKPGDVVGICAENRFEYAFVLFGSLFVGATLSPMNVSYTERELNHAVKLSKPKIIFATANTLDKIMKVARQNLCIQKIICFNETRGTDKFPTGIMDFTRFCKSSSQSVTDFRCEPVDLEKNIAFILYSSGTTGQPKGVMLTQKNAVSVLTVYFLRPRELEQALVPNQVIISIIPWFHTFGNFNLLRWTMLNTKMIFLPKFEDRKFLGCVQKYKATSTVMVPPLMVFLAKSPLVDEYDLSSLKIIWCGAAMLSKELEDKVKTRLNIPIIRQGYGMTEASILTGQTDHNQKPGSVGVPNAGIYGRVVDTETGKILGPYQNGELHFKGNTIMKGYIDDKLSTDNMIDTNGWLQTGDIGYVDDEGEFFIVDRLKELIKYKAFQVPPAEIEAILLQHPGISDAGVVGVPDEAAGELPLAFVVKQANATITEKEIIDYVAGVTSPAKRLHGGVRFINEIPKNPSGKLLRRELRAMLAPRLSKL